MDYLNTIGSQSNTFGPLIALICYGVVVVFAALFSLFAILALIRYSKSKHTSIAMSLIYAAIFMLLVMGGFNIISTLK